MQLNPPIRIFIADDHPIFRMGVRAVLAAEADMRLIGEAHDAEELLRLIPSTQPDILLLDVSMPGMSGLDVLPRLSLSYPRTKIIVLTASLDAASMGAALANGARGVLLKHFATDLLTKCIRRVMAGEYWVGRDRVGDLVEGLRQVYQLQTASSTLTPRELEIVGRVVRAESNKAIAAALGIGEQTVKNHLRNIFEKVGVTNRVELALKAKELQLG